MCGRVARDAYTPGMPERRELHFKSLDEILDHVEALDGHTVRATGNWTPAQNVRHVADGILGSVDGFPVHAPADAQQRARRRKDALLEDGFPTGIELAGDLARLKPPAGVTWAAAVSHLRSAVTRAIAEGMTKPHAVLGPLTEDEWVRFHCRHAELHFGFLAP